MHPAIFSPVSSSRRWGRAALASALLLTLAAPTTAPLANATEATAAAAEDPTGGTFGDTVVVSQPGIRSGSQDAAIDAQGRTHVVWRELGDNYDIHHRVLMPDGTTGPSHNLSDLVPEGQHSSRPTVDVHGDVVTVLWLEPRPASGQNDVWYARSHDGGATFGPPAAVAATDAHAWDYDVDRDGERLVVAVREETVGIRLYTSHADGGFAEGETLPVVPRDLDLAAEGGVDLLAYVTYDDQLHVRRRAAGDTAGWSDHLLAADEPAGNVTVLVTGQHARVVWGRSAPTAIRSAASADGGVTWAAPTDLFLDDTGRGDVFPQFVADAADGVFHVAYATLRGTERVGGYLRGAATGTTFTETSLPVSPDGVDLDVDGQTVVIGAPLRVPSTTDAPWTSELLATTSGDGGRTLAFEILNPAPGTIAAADPVVAAASGTTTVTWRSLTRTDAPSGEIATATRHLGDGDLVIVDVQAVQGPLDYPALVQHRRTAIRVVVRDGVGSGSHTVALRVEAPVTEESPEPAFDPVVTTIRTTPGESTHYVPVGDLDHTIFGNDSSQTAVDVTATIDPENRIAEADEDNNAVTNTQPLVRTRGLSVIFVPVAHETVGHHLCAAGSQFHQFVTGSISYLNRTFPIEHLALRRYDQAGIVQEDAATWNHAYERCTEPILLPDGPVSDLDLKALFLRLDAMTWWADATEDHHVHVVGVVPPGWFANHTSYDGSDGGAVPAGLAMMPNALWSVDASLVEADWRNGVPLAHELAHTLGWVAEGHPLEDPDSPAHLVDVDTEGYDTQEWRVRSGEPDFMLRAIQREDPFSAANQRFVSRETYHHLLERLVSDADRPNLPVLAPTAMAIQDAGATSATSAAAAGPALGIRGTITADGTTTLLDLTRVPSAPDVPLGADGEVTVEYLDGAGKTVAATGFTPAGELDLHGGTVDSEQHAFAVRLPVVDGAVGIRLLRDGVVVAERQASAAAPDVTVTGPGPLTVGQPVDLDWSATDTDGDELTAAVSLSVDGGASWTPLAVDVDGTTLPFIPTRDHLSDSAVLRVAVSDGWHTTVATTAPFSVSVGGGARIVFDRWDGYNLNRNNLMSVAVDGSDPVTVTDVTYAAAAPVFSRDGNRIAYLEQREFSDGWRNPDCCRIVVADADGANPRTAFDYGTVLPGGQAAWLYANDATVTWSPDGTELAIRACGYPTTGGSCRITIVSADGSAPPRDVSTPGMSPTQLDWSGDGSRIAFRYDNASIRGSIAVVNLTTGAVDAVSDQFGTDHLVDAPTFSADGTRLAFFRSDDEAGIWTMNPDGSDARRVHATSGGGVTDLAWMPDGSGFLWSQGGNYESDLWRVAVDGSNAARVTDLPGPETSPSMQPVGGAADDPAAPTVVANASVTVAAREGQPATLDASASRSLTGQPLTFAWDTDGDGQYDDGDASTIEIVYPGDGTYRAAVRVTDPTGVAATAAVPVTVAPVAPEIRDVAAAVGAGGAVLLTATLADVPGELLTATVDWCDGTVEDVPVFDGPDGARIVAEHRYAAPGTYCLSIMASDESGEVDDHTVSIEVTGIAPEVGLATSASVALGTPLTRTGWFIDPDSAVWTATVDPGDGTASKPLDVDTTNRTFVLSHAYGATGTYVATVTVTDDAGHTSTVLLEVEVVDATVAPPRAAEPRPLIATARAEADGLPDSPETVQVREALDRAMQDRAWVDDRTMHPQRGMEAINQAKEAVDVLAASCPAEAAAGCTTILDLVLDALDAVAQIAIDGAEASQADASVVARAVAHLEQGRQARDSGLLTEAVDQFRQAWHAVSASGTR